MEIFRTKSFDRDIRRIGATDDDIAALLADLVEDPSAGDVIKGMRGVRKVRFALPSRRIGKRGGGRAIYLVAEVRGALFMLRAYAKNEKADLSDEDRKGLLRVVEELGV